MKNKKSLKLAASVAISLAFAFFVGSCGPDNPTPNYQMVPQESKDWGVFQKGTWWVYEEETLKYRDSVYVYRTEEKFFEPSKRPEAPGVQDLSTYIRSSLRLDSMIIQTSSIGPQIKLIQVAIDIPEYSSSCYILPIPPFLEKQGVTIGTGPTSQFTIFDSIYPALKLGELEFTDVIRANNNMNLAYNGTPTLIYSAKHIGIIRKEFPEYNQVWNLVKYNIVQ
jgi:hypothetical protein